MGDANQLPLKEQLRANDEAFAKTGHLFGLETLHRKEHRADPGLNTLLAMGAVAGGRPIPPFRVPAAVHPMVRAAAKE